ncbi:MAG TPA: GxxExxY protein [Candidatus Bipolaricaulota bacterium]|nr:GxxExxY protein [Candidatus Bipolaricaulota bacterium]
MPEFYYKDLSDKIIGIFFEVYNENDFGFRERYYEDIAYQMIMEKGIRVQRQYAINLLHKGKYSVRRRADFLIENKMLVELKVGKKIIKKHFDQLYEYLVATDLRLGLIILFNSEEVQVRRVVNDPEHQKKSQD